MKDISLPGRPPGKLIEPWASDRLNRTMEIENNTDMASINAQKHDSAMELSRMMENSSGFIEVYYISVRFYEN